MRIYQIQVRFEIQFATRPGDFSRGFPPARSLYPDKVLEVLVVVLVGYMCLFPPANERTKEAGNEQTNKHTNERPGGRTDGRTENLQLTRASL